MPRITVRPDNIPPLAGALALVSSLEEIEVDTLRQEVSGKEGFDASLKRTERVASLLPRLKIVEIVGLLKSLEFLYVKTRDWVDADETPSDVLRHLLKASALWEHLGERAEVAFGRLQRLLADNPAAEVSRKREWLRTGVLENATGFASFVDLRPNFSRDRSEVSEFIPIIAFEIDLEDQVGEERSCVFQVTERGLAKFRDTVNDAIRKIEALKSQQSLRGMIAFDDDKSEKP